MTSWFNSCISNKFVAILIAGIFVVVTFACFTMATNHGHGLDVGAACETVMNLADNTVIQTGLVLLLVVAAACLCFRSSNPFSLSDALKRFQVFYSSSSNYFVSRQEYSYLRELFSSGLIHAKLHSLAV
ncbi:hypothetical protein CL653_02805 [bacterium]|nr:hypothetical protein [bacterium]|tara:strand:+ start:1538 stop:1924 length:387 start_codon:yes stop_codon:yes gene_type:complete